MKRIILLNLLLVVMLFSRATPGNGCLTITCPANVTADNDSGMCGSCNVILVPPPVVDTPVTLDFADRYVTYTGVSINGGGNVAVVAPGSTVSLSFSMSVSFNYNTGYCPGCVVQSYIGIGGSSTTITCDNGIGDGYTNSYNGVTFTAPTIPGLYYLTQSGSLQYSCVTVGFNNVPSNAIGVIQIGQGVPVVTDTCAVATITSNAPACFSVGTTVVTWTATDSLGDTVTCTQNVTVMDTTAPVITCPADVTADNDSGMCGSCNVTLVPPPVVATPVTLDFADRYVTYTGVSINGGGNAAVVAPGSTVSLSFSMSVSFNYNTGYCPGCVVQSYIGIGGSSTTITCDNGIGDGYTNSYNGVTFTAPTIPGLYYLTQSGSLQYSCVTVGFNNVPSNAIGVIQIGQGVPVVTDNCSVATITSNAPTCFPVGTTVVTWTATDSAGNVRTGTQNVTVTDTTAPVITCPADVTAGNDSGMCGSCNVTLVPPPVVATPVTLDFADRYVTYTGVSINGGGNAAVVAPGSTVSLSFSMSVSFNYNTGYCPGCVVQSYIGIGGSSTTITCDNGIGDGYTNSYNGVTFTAPTIPGLYYLTQSGSLQYSCVTVGFNNVPSNAIGVIQIGQGVPVVTDNCSVATITNNAPACFPVGITVVTWTATDSAGNTATCTQNVTVTDTTAPVITCPGNVSVASASNMCGAAVAFSVTATDNCSATVVSTPASGSTFSVGTTTVTSVASDPSGNTDTCTFTVTVIDSTAPVITCPADVTADNDSGMCGSCNVTLVPPPVVATPVTLDFADRYVTYTGVSINGGGNAAVVAPGSTVSLSFSMSVSFNYNTGYCPGCVVQSYIGIGGSSTTITCDNGIGDGYTNSYNGVTFTAPTIPGLYYLTQSGSLQYSCVTVGFNNVPSNAIGVIQIGQGVPVVTDNCAVATITNNAPTCFPVGITVVTWTATDSAGNTATCTQNVTVTDTTAPVITCPGNISVASASNICGAVVTFSVTATDNCSATVVSTPASGSTFSVGTTTVTSVASDPSGNTDTCTFTVTVIDSTAPVITCPADVTAGNDSGMCGSCNVTLVPPPVVATPVTLDYADRYITYTGVSINGGGNVAVVAPGSTVSLSFSMSVSFNYNTGYCPGCVVQSYIGIGGSSTTITCDNGIGDGYTNSYNGVTFTAPTIPGLYYLTQSGSLQYSCVTVGFNNVPSNAIGVIQIGQGVPVVTDNCAVATITNNAPTCFPVGITVVTWTATDSAGNTATCTQNVTVTDTTAPVITCPGNISVASASNICGAVVTFSVTATDNCSATVVSTPASGSTFSVGTTTVTSVASDPSGNTDTCTFTVTVIDSTAPVITCPADVTAGNDSGMCGSCNVTLVPPPVVATPVTLDYADRYITYTGVSINGGGNVAVVAPGSTVSLSFSMSVSFNYNTGYCPGCVVQSYIGIGGSSTTITCDNGIGDGYTNSYNGVTFTAPTIPGLYYLTQSGSLQYSCVTVGFNNVPSNAIGVIQIGQGVPVVTDNCAVATITNNAPTCFPVGITVVTWTATDSAGNVSTCTQNVTVTDTTAPVITCPADVSYVTDPNSCTHCEPSFSSAVPTMAGSPITLDYADRYVTYTGISVNGGSNAAIVAPGSTVSLSFNMSVSFNYNTGYCPGCIVQSYIGIGGSSTTITCDNGIGNGYTNSYNGVTFTAPTTPGVYYITQSGSLQYSCVSSGFGNDSADAIAVIEILQPVQASDICGQPTVTNNAPACFPVGITVVTWTATDSSGNTATCTQNVTVTDTTAPVITCPGNISVASASNICGAIVTFSVTATDNCSATVVSTPASGSTFSVGTTTVTSVASDPSGNTDTCTFTVTVAPYTNTVNDTICRGGAYNLNGTLITQPGNYIDTLTSSFGCDSIVNLNLTVLPVFTSALNETICAGSSYNFNGTLYTQVGTYMDTVSSTNGCDSIITLTLSVNPVMTSSISASVCSGSSYNFNGTPYSQPGTYRDTLTGLNGCDSIVILTLTVSPAFNVNLGNDTSICSGNTVELNAGNSGDTYQWSDNSTSQSVTANSTGTYSVTVTNSFHCSASASVSITVDPAPVLTFDTIQSACVSNTVVLLANNPGSTYQWSTGTTGESLTVTTSGTYSVTVTSSAHCSASASSLVTFNPLPAGVDSFLPVCNGNTVVLNAGNAGSTYLWSNGATTQILTVSLGNYVVTVTNIYGCTATSNFNVSDEAITAEITGVTTICHGESTTLDAGNMGSSYQWSTNATAETISVTIGGTYSVTVASLYGCSASASAAVDVVNPGTVLLDLKVHQVCINAPVVVLNGGSPVGGTYSGSGVTAGTFNPSSVSPGTYEITYSVTDSGCTASASDTITVNNCTGIQEVTASFDVSLFPNPSSGSFDLVINNSNAGEFSIDIFDVEGRRIIETLHESSQAQYSHSFDLSSVAKGVYFVRVVAGEEEVAIKRLVLQ